MILQRLAVVVGCLVALGGCATVTEGVPRGAVPVSATSSTLSHAGIDGVLLGMSVEQAKSAAEATGTALPKVSKTGVEEAEWRGCTLTFNNGTLVRIAPPSTVKTVEGLGVGDDVKRLGQLFGDVDLTTAAPRSTAVVAVDKEAGNGYEIDFKPTNVGKLDGTITKIVLCRCGPRPFADSPPEVPNCPTIVNEKVDITHPYLGTLRLFAVTKPLGSNSRLQGCVIAVDRSHKVVQAFEVAGFDDRLRFADPVTDASGNFFVNYNPGRYNGIMVLVPTPTGFEPLGAERGNYTGKRLIYYAELEGPGDNGQYVIKQFANDCKPDCAHGTITSKVLHWNGTDYVE
ncbi:MAG: hypothetical protein LLG14_26670 [Nocardiaceae bacterium]|nr:hypothetical protein [Nocardiaceae bacterium]